MWAVTYIGVVIFVGLTAYDTQKLKNIGEQIDVRDSSNLLLMLLRIFGNRR